MSSAAATDPAPMKSGADPLPDRLTVFAWLWACQALVHQEFYSGWLRQGDPRGWAVTILATGTMLRPSSLPLFSGMLLASIVYNVAKWPFVVNHILLETLINATILAAIAAVYGPSRRRVAEVQSLREQVVDRFASVVAVMVAVMYWFAFVAKLNADFINPDVSCVAAMYGDLQRRLPFLPDTRLAHSLAIALTLLVEGLIPLLLSFRRTRPWAVLLGLPFHFLLGLVGHRTFSGLAFAVYGLLVIDQLTCRVRTATANWQRRTPSGQRRRLYAAAVVSVAVLVAGLIAADLAGQFRARLAGVAIYQIPWLIWIGWSFLIGGMLAGAIVAARSASTAGPLHTERSHPGWLWAGVAIVVLMGLSPYLGWKTETCFTMYSNLRTEAEWNNHFFMPAWKLGPWQTDLVKIVDTDHPSFARYVEHGDLIAYFELRRIVNQTPREQSFHVSYVRNGEPHVLAQTATGRIHSAGDDPHPPWLGRLLYFRPVPTDVCTPCRH